MTVFGFIIKINTSLQENSLSIVFLLLTLFFIYMGMAQSGNFASYRFGNSIVPNESQLIRSGPYIMQKDNVRLGKLIRFKPVSGGSDYVQRNNDFNKSQNILMLVEKQKNQPVAYLWLYPDNPVRQVWKVEINQETVLSYDRALFDYRTESDPTFFLKISAACFAIFLLSMINITRVRINVSTKLEV